MKRTHLLISTLLVLASAGVHAQMYKSVGADGKVTYSDTPPPKAGKVEAKTGARGESIGVALPYTLNEAVKNHPVTLYTGKDCNICDMGRSLLVARGVPFAEKIVASKEDAEKLKQAGSDNQLPLLTIGRNKQLGFEAANWNSALTLAGYPTTNMLPKGYQRPQAESAAPVEKVAEKPVVTTTSTTESLPPATGKAPPGFRF